MKYGPTFFPTVRDVEVFHDIVILQRGERGYVSRGLVNGALEWAMTDIYNYVPFPSLLLKAAALMYAYVCFHPFSDGNKRTALMTTSFFLNLNACHLNIPDNAPEFARDLAMRTIDDMDHEPATEVNRVSGWLKTHVKRTFWAGFDYAQKAKSAIKQGLSGDIYLTEDLMPHQARLVWGLESAINMGPFFHLGSQKVMQELSRIMHTSLLPIS